MWLLPARAVQRTKAYLKRLVHTFSLPFVLVIFLAYCFIKGTLYSFLETAILPYFQAYVRVSGERYHDYLTIAALPWSMKAIFATVSDVLPIRGYHKRYYICGAALLSALALTIIAVSTLTTKGKGQVRERASWLAVASLRRGGGGELGKTGGAGV